MKKHAKTSQEGFSLLEVSIALIIIGLIGGLGLNALTIHFQNRSTQITKENQEKIMRMLAAHVMKTGSLPLPADPSATGEHRGVQGDTRDYQGVSIGIIPYKTLGVSEKMVKDGWGRYVTYAMNTHLFNFTPATNTQQKLQAYLTQTRSSLVILDQNLSPLTSRTDLVSVVLVSHGKYGHGAFTTQGQQRRSSRSGPLQETNAALNPTYVDAPISIQSGSYFDDIVTWATRDSLLSIFGNAPQLLAPR